MTSLTRRHFLNSLALASASVAMPRLLLANADTDSRFVFIILRGALDGLAAVPPYGDGNYARVRGELALSQSLKLDGLFGLHPSLTNLHARYQQNEAVIFHAIASPYRERSHFDGQDLLENGTLKPHGANDGWLNRALGSMGQKRDTEKLAMAFAQNIPLVLRGDQRVGSWAPSRLPDTDSDTLQRLADLYAGNDYFSSRLHAAIDADAMAMGSGSGEMGSDRRNPLAAVGTIAAAAGRMLKANDGPRFAVIETTGWDTHANQGAERGQLATRLSALDNAIDSLRVELGDAWRKTVVLVVTEFGRTVAVNGTRGTDHGTATCAFLIGGAVKGGRVVTDWPGLSQTDLYQGRDLKPTMDLRSVAKGILGQHMNIADRFIEKNIFPDSAAAPPLAGLVRST